MNLAYHKKSLQKSVVCTAHISAILKGLSEAFLLIIFKKIANALEIETYKLFREE